MKEEDDDNDVKYIGNIISAFLLVSCFIGLMVCLPIFFTNGYINYNYLVGNCTVQNVTLENNKIIWDVNISIMIKDSLYTHNGFITIKGGENKLNKFKDIYKSNHTYICYQDEYEKNNKIFWFDYQIDPSSVAWFTVIQASLSIFTLCFVVGCVYGIYHEEMILYRRSDYDKIYDNQHSNEPINKIYEKL